MAPKKRAASASLQGQPGPSKRRRGNQTSIIADVEPSIPNSELVSNDENDDDVSDIEGNVENGDELDKSSWVRKDQGFLHILRKASEHGLTNITQVGEIRGKHGKLRIGTLCSGSEAPIYAMEGLQRAAHRLGLGEIFQFEHVLSCEIEAFKQAFIRRNQNVKLVFRDVCEVGAIENTEALVAEGVFKVIPLNLDIVIFGSSCVDFSHLNANCKSFKNESLNFAGAAGSTRHTGDLQIPHGSNPDYVWDLINMLNTTKGESMKTFLGSLLYVTKARPSVVILENVVGATWAGYVKHFGAIGYTATFIKLDSKNYLMPQTRMRGYLLAIDQQAAGDRADLMVKTWKELVTQLSFTERMSVDEFLLPQDDERVIRARAQMEDKGTIGRQSKNEWTRSRTRHEATRDEHNLTSDTSISQLEISAGRCVHISPPSRSWRIWWENQPVRIMDVLEIFYQIGLKRNADFAYKSLITDLSQNADRERGLKATNAAGIIGCITPVGIFFYTDQLRPITGIEALSMQGIPIDKLILSTESQSQLQDLAGNAMTVTVVGTALLAAFMSIIKHQSEDKKVFDITPHVRPPSKAERAAVESGVTYHNTSFAGSNQGQQLMPIEDWQSIQYQDGEEAFGKLLKLCKDGRRYCFCPFGVSSSHIFECPECHETACEHCWGNPRHEGRQLKRNLPRRLNLQGLKVSVFAFFPGRFLVKSTKHVLRSFNEQHVEHCSDVTRKVWRATQAILDSQVFYLQDMKTTADLTVLYSSSQAVMKAVISDESIIWYLSISREYENYKELQRDFDISQPVARLVIRKGDEVIPAGSHKWELWVEQKICFEHATMVVDEDKSRLSFEVSDSNALSRLPHEAAADIKANLQLATGEYLRRPLCATAENSLFAKREDKADLQSQVFLFKDPARIGQFDKDGFVIAMSCRHLENHEFREVLLRFDPKCRPNRDQNIKVVGAHIKGYWAKSAGAVVMDVKATTDLGDEVLKFGSQAEFDRHNKDKRCDTSNPPILLQVEAGLCKFPLDIATMAEWTLDRIQRSAEHSAGQTWYTVLPWELPTFLSNFSFLFKKIVETSAKHKSLVKLQDVKLLGSSDEACSRCMRIPPQAQWVKLGDGQRPELFESPKAISDIENFVIGLPRPVIGQVRLLQPTDLQDDEESRLSREDDLGADMPRAIHVAAEHDSVFLSRLVVNPNTLAHLAQMSLLLSHRFPRPQHILSQMVSSYQIDLKYKPPNTSDFEPFYKSLQPSGFSVKEPSMQILNTTGLSASRKAQFDTISTWLAELCIKTPYLLQETDQKEACHLDDDQTSSLVWMVGKERCPSPFIERETEECIIPGLNMRMTGTATYSNHGVTPSSRGGVLAHEVGFGKTVVTLGLLDAQRAYDRGEGLKERHEGDPSTKEATPRFHDLKATLIIVPVTIVDQWQEEVANKLGRAWKVECFKSAKILRTCSLKKLMDADIIIISVAVFKGAAEGSYLPSLAMWSRLAIPCAKPEGRLYRDWYQKSVGYVRENLSHWFSLSRDPLRTQKMKAYLAGRENELQKENEAFVEEIVNPSRRKKNDSQKKNTSTDSQNDDDGTSKPRNGKGASKENTKGKGKMRGKKTDDTEAKDGNKTVKPAEFDNGIILELFSFARVVLDECSYEDERIREFFSTARANFKWLLSATPDLRNLSAVCNMASYLNYHVARYEPNVMPGLPAVTEGPEESPLAETERFRSFQGVKSLCTTIDRHRQGEQFVQSFFRQNSVDLNEHLEGEYRIPVQLTLPELVLYLDFELKLGSCGGTLDGLSEDVRAKLAGGTRLDGNGADLARKALFLRASCNTQGFMAKANNEKTASGVLQEALSLAHDTMVKRGRSLKQLFDFMIWLYPRVIPIKLQDDKDHKNGKPKESINSVERAFRVVESWSSGDSEVEWQLWKFLHGGEGSTKRFQESTWGARHHGNGQTVSCDWYVITKGDLEGLGDKEVDDLACDVAWVMARYANLNPDALDEIPSDEQDDFYNPLLKVDREVARKNMEKVAGMSRAQKEAYILTKQKAILPVCKGDYSGSKSELVELCRQRGIFIPATDGAGKLKERLIADEQGTLDVGKYRTDRITNIRFEEYPVPGRTRKRFNSTAEISVHDLISAYETFRGLWELFTQDYYRKRYIQSIMRLNGISHDRDGKLADLNCTACPSVIPHVKDACVVPICGHIICGDCMEVLERQYKKECPANQCKANCRETPRVQGTKLIKLGSEDIDMLESSKVKKVADMVENIPEDDSILVFVQYDEVKEEIVHALKRRKITLIASTIARTYDVAEPRKNLRTRAKTTRATNKQAGEEEETSEKLYKAAGQPLDSDDISAFSNKKARVLVLNLNSIEAAGANLTVANNIIFACPLNEPDRYRYDTYIRQAKGRCLRRGQGKKVRIYHLFAAMTVEEKAQSHATDETGAGPRQDSRPPTAQSIPGLFQHQDIYSAESDGAITWHPLVSSTTVSGGSTPTPTVSATTPATTLDASRPGSSTSTALLPFRVNCTPWFRPAPSHETPRVWSSNQGTAIYFQWWSHRGANFKPDWTHTHDMVQFAIERTIWSREEAEHMAAVFLGEAGQALEECRMEKE